jgi:hypothetical protein
MGTPVIANQREDHHQDVFGHADAVALRHFGDDVGVDQFFLEDALWTVLVRSDDKRVTLGLENLRRPNSPDTLPNS